MKDRARHLGLANYRERLAGARVRRMNNQRKIERDGGAVIDAPFAEAFAAGGDLGNRFPHGTNARELEYLVRAGLSPLQAIQAATGNAACALKRDKLLGAIEAGRLADLLIVDGDPLADIRILQDRGKLALVLKEGRPVAGRLRGVAER
jgi:hypothetical protein